MIDNPARLFSIQPTTRFERLRKQYMEFSSRPLPLYSIDVDRIITRVMRDTEGEAMILRRAKAFAAVVSEVPIEIFPDEPFVGWISGRPDANLLCAEQKAGFLEKELEAIPTISSEDKRIVREEIIPYWRGDGGYRRSRIRQAYEKYPPELRTLLYEIEDPSGELSETITKMRVPGIPFVKIDGAAEISPVGVIGELMSHHHIGHGSHGYEKILQKGFLGIKEDAEKRMARIDPLNPEDLKIRSFLEAVIIAMEAAAGIGARFAALARENAIKEKNTERQAELNEIAAACDQVPALPARTFREALQSVWFAHILHWWETPLCRAIAPGRVDQFLFPFFKNDIDAKRLSVEKAQDLIDCWLLRMTQDAAPYVAESGEAHHIDLGGYKADGSDAVNDLSYLFLEGMMHTRLNEPNLGVLVHGKTPDKFLIRACELASLGFGQPMFLNADVFVENILARGTLGGPPVPLELARLSGAIGCNEPHVTNYESEYQTGGTLRMPAALTLALSDGWNPSKQLQTGLKTGDPRTFASFKDLQEAFRTQLSYLVKMCAVAININELILADVYPTAYVSALIEDCIEKGIPREEGGARFNFGPCIATSGAVDVANSLAAIKKFVFEEKSISMDRLLVGLAENFKTDDLLRQKLLAAPKFGNNDDYVDDLAVWVMKIFCEEVASQKNTRGGYMMPYQNPLGLYVPFGTLTPAMPSGRKAGEPLSDGISPTIGSDVSGPTAVIRSVGKIDSIRLYHGQSLNMRLDGSAFREKDGIGRFVALIRTFLDQKIHHIQFNLVSNEILRAAQEKPEDYRDLVVRVAGYCAYFVQLRKKIQDSIIDRTVHGK